MHTKYILQIKYTRRYFVTNYKVQQRL